MRSRIRVILRAQRINLIFSFNHFAVRDVHERENPISMHLPVSTSTIQLKDEEVEEKQEGCAC